MQWNKHSIVARFIGVEFTTGEKLAVIFGNEVGGMNNRQLN
jgi:tRNA C32,U32 (ribose-2'-O)-methylase TrmJ